MPAQSEVGAARSSPPRSVRWPKPLRRWLTACVFAAAHATIVEAQSIVLIPVLREGEDLKIFPRDSVMAQSLAFQTAKFSGMRSDTIVATRWRPASNGIAGGNETIALALASLDSILVERRTEGRARRDAAAEGLLIGGFAGALYGTLIGGIVAMVSKDVDSREGTGKGALIGTGVGAAFFGGLSLFQEPPAEYGVRWERVRWENRTRTPGLR